MKPWTMVACAAGAAALIWGGSAVIGLGEDESNEIEGAVVERGPLRISVVERGNLKAAESVTLKSEIEGQTTILWLIEEGVQVQPGDLLVELDTAQLEDRRVQQEIKVQNSEASLIKAQQNFAIQESQNESDVASGERQLEFAGIDLEKYVEGDMPQQLQKLEEDILIADEELSRATQDVVWSEELQSRGFLEQAQLDADRLAKTRSDVKVKQAVRAKELYTSYEIPRRRKELEAEVDEKQRELERIKLQARARIADYEANLRSSQATFDVERKELDDMNSQLSKARIHAPVAGMVVYAIEERGRWGGGEPMQEGATVRERQEIVTIPSSAGYVADVSLHESVLEKVDVGMECRVTVDAVGAAFPGEVTFKAVLPDQGSWWANPDLRVYRTQVRVLAQDSRIRSGMSCSIEILVDELQDTLFIPVQCVFLDGGNPVCFVSGATVEKRPVEIGQNNGKWVEILSGLEQGEVVLLSVPADQNLEPAPTRHGEGDGGWGQGAVAAETGAAMGDDKPKGKGKSKGEGKSDGDGKPGATKGWTGKTSGKAATAGEDAAGKSSGGAATPSEQAAESDEDADETS